MVKLVKCVNGHFYDKNKTSSCPHCDIIKTVLEPTASVFTISGTSVETSSDSSSSDETNNSPLQPTPSPTPSDSILSKDAATSDKYVFNPTTGWLIVLEGDVRGQDYCLKTDKNTVGRSKENNISIEADRLMSRKHASLYYYPKLNSFFIENLSSQGTKVNGQPISEKTRLNDRDVIEMGSTMFLLKTLCDEHFIWRDFNEDTTAVQTPK
ncbi:MAG: FHA domain-containing protein [Nitrospirae bacterium]|nr:FHA domain-containing protein [Nitrospirota bacterium]MBF0590989.1 FHA domain-containing protein [Nitrospirota bacterium]